MEDQPLKTISKIMNMPVNSVKSHLHRAKIRMREVAVFPDEEGKVEIKK